MPTTQARNAKLNLRLTPSEHRALQLAALAAGRSISDFVLESALARAEETLPDRQRFCLTAEQWTAFQTALYAPPQASPRLAALLSEHGIFDYGGF
jgi:uncharacterized protein (DUF1778 family)